MPFSLRRTRTLRKCSFDARSKGQPWPFPQNRGIGDQKALRRTSFIRSSMDRILSPLKEVLLCGSA